MNVWRSPKQMTLAERQQRDFKVYDAFYFFNELDILDIRLHILDPYVDKFIIVEATETFTGKPKPLLFEANQHRFKKFLPKIIYHVTTDTPANDEDLKQRLHQHSLRDVDRRLYEHTLRADNFNHQEIQWLKEFYQKEALQRPLANLHDNDVVYISDVDEIWNPDRPIDYSRPDIYKFKQTAYYYYLNNRSNDNWITGWTGTVATQYRNIRTGCINQLRNHIKNRYTVIPRGGWHFTFQGGAERIRSKLDSYGHVEFNDNDIRAGLEQAIQQNRDYRGRRLTFRLDDSSLPPYLLTHRATYSHLFK